MCSCAVAVASIGVLDRLGTEHIGRLDRLEVIGAHFHPVYSHASRIFLRSAVAPSDMASARISFVLSKTCAVFGGCSTSFIARIEQVRGQPMTARKSAPRTRQSAR